MQYYINYNQIGSRTFSWTKIYDYNMTRGEIPQASKVLQNWPIEAILGLPHNKKQQWLLSIKVA